MYVLTAEKRDIEIKVKQLRKNGMVPATACGGSLTETLHVQIPYAAAKKLLKAKSRGGNLTLECEGKKYNVLLKDISCDAISGSIRNLSFQSLTEGKFMNGTAQVVITGRETVSVMIQQLLNEIPYKALPSDLVEQIEIDVTGMKLGDCVKIEDLEIAKNPNIEFLIPTDSMILNLIEGRTQQSAEPEAEDAAE
ncbi:MAG: hypothetical protein RR314_05980 [Oscillospiraceae bacterium]